MSKPNLASQSTGISARCLTKRCGQHWEALVYVLLVASALTLRLWDLDSRAVHHDESLHGYFSWLFAQGMGYKHDAVTHGPFQFHITALVFQMFGANEFTLRLMPAIFGSALIALPYFLKPFVGRVGALAAAVFLLISPTMFYFSRFARNDIYMAVWTLSLVIVTWKYLQTGKARYLPVVAALLALSFTTKETAFLVTALLVGFLFVVAIGDVISWIQGRKRLSQFSRSGILLILFITLTMPQWSAATALFQDWTGLALANTMPDLGRLGVPLGSSLLKDGVVSSELFLAIVIVLGTVLLSIALGLRWNARYWAVSAGAFYGIWITLYTTLFTNFFGGIGSGIWQSLGYWITQHEVARGNQPWYYYLVTGFNYEYLVLFLGILGGAYFILKGSLFSRFLIYWSAVTFLSYTLAGEKMPWLLVNIVLPLTILAGKVIGGLSEKIHWRRLRLMNCLLPVSVGGGLACLLAGIQAYTHASNASPPISVWILVLCGTAGLATAIILLVRMPRPEGAALALLGIVLLMGIGTAGTSLRATYSNGDIPTELLVYTQTSPEVPEVLGHIEALAQRVGIDPTDLIIIVDGADGYAWPWAWYLRNFNNVSYPDLASDPLVALPNADVILLNTRSLPNNQAFLNEYTTVMPYRHRWWHPETYRNLSPEIIAGSVVNREGWRGTLNYFFSRTLGTDLGSSNALAYLGPPRN